MVNIYTRTGDDGNTHLFGGDRVSKNSPRVIAYGTVDELNSIVGMTRVSCPYEEVTAALKEIQSLLFVCGAGLANPERDGAKDRESGERREIEEADVEQLETWIDSYSEELDPLDRFVVPGETEFAARCHFARSVCRRAERHVVSLQETGTEVGTVLPFLNRLSDFLFTLARLSNAREGVEETPWSAHA